MLHDFLDANRPQLIERCRAKAPRRGALYPTTREAEYGIPLFLGQLIETLRNAQNSAAWAGLEVPEPSQPPKKQAQAEIATTAAKHGRELLRQGFTVEQVIHNYGDLCQAVTELATERHVPVSTDDFRTFNGCLDDAIADAVTEFGEQHDHLISEMGDQVMSERLGFLADELRNFLNTALASFAAIRRGTATIDGATSAALDRSLAGIRDLVDRELADVRLTAGLPSQLDYFAVGQFIAEVQVAADVAAKGNECEFTVWPVESALMVHVDKHLLHSAVSILLQNAFKFTPSHGHVSLKAYGAANKVLIEVADECGGLPEGEAGAMFHSFGQHGVERSGLDLGLSISRRAVETCGGTLNVRDMPGIGCVFTIEMPRGDGPVPLEADEATVTDTAAAATDVAAHPFPGDRRRQRSGDVASQLPAATPPTGWDQRLDANPRSSTANPHRH
jgi:signal transduction histidine kinase